MATELDPALQASFLQKYEYEGCLFAGVVFPDSLGALKTFDVRPDDVWICSYPKSGTHFAMEIVSLILGDGDPLKVNRLTCMSTVAMIMVDQLFAPPPAEGDGQSTSQGPPQGQPFTPFIEVIKKAPSPRMILSHLPFQFLPPNIEKRAKVIYVSRNPKDMLTSMITFTEKTIQIPGGFPQLIQDIISGDISYGAWFDHVMGYWKKREDGKLLFLKYEDMKRDLRGTVQKVAQLLGHPLSDALLRKVVEGSEFDGMKKTYDQIEKASEKGILLTRAGGAMPFMQTGVVGRWKTQFTVAQNEMFDAWYLEKFSGLDLKYEFE